MVATSGSFAVMTGRTFSNFFTGEASGEAAEVVWEPEAVQSG